MFDNFVKEYQKVIQGEDKTIRFLLLVMSSRWVINKNSLSFHTLLNSESGAGKDFVLQTVLKLFEPECYTGFTRISARALDYLEPYKIYSCKPETWGGKFLGLEDIESSILNSSTLKVFLSNGSKTAIVTDKGISMTQHKGSPIILMTSAYSDPNVELMRRINIINLDESDEQTYNILMKQASNNKEKIDYSKLKKYIDTLKDYKINIPYAWRIAKIISHKGTHMRTFYPRLMDFIKASAVFNQHKRTITNNIIYATKEDYEIVKMLFENLSLTTNFNPLSRSKKEMLSTLIYEFEGDWFNTKDSASIMNISYKSMFKNIQSFVLNGLLETKINRSEFNIKPTYYYKPKEEEKLLLPTFEELFLNE